MRNLRIAHLDGWQIKNMLAPWWRFYIPLDGGGVVCWQGEEHALQPGEWMLMAPNTAASCFTRTPFRKLFMQVFYEQPGYRSRPGIHRGRVSSVYQRAIAALAQAGTGEPLSLPAVRLAQHLALTALTGLPEEALVAHPLLPKSVQETVAVLEARLDDPPDNGELARRAGMHPNSLVRLFRQHLGLSPQRYGRQHRLAQACVLLADPALSIEAIAEACGFLDRSHFSHAFAQRWGCGPATFRKRNHPQDADCGALNPAWRRA